jgi:hypothetical protein
MTTQNIKSTAEPYATAQRLATARRRINSYARRAYAKSTEMGRANVMLTAQAVYRMAVKGEDWEASRLWTELVELARLKLPR